MKPLIVHFLPPAAASLRGQSPRRRPNDLFIISDDHGYQTINSYDGRLNQTPNSDRIAQDGARFEQSFCTNSICAPSRATLRTGASRAMITVANIPEGMRSTVIMGCATDALFHCATTLFYTSCFVSHHIHSGWPVGSKRSEKDKSGPFFLNNLQTNEGFCSLAAVPGTDQAKNKRRI